jgi:hypothetical protein
VWGCEIRPGGSPEQKHHASTMVFGHSKKSFISEKKCMLYTSESLCSEWRAVSGGREY